MLAYLKHSSLRKLQHKCQCSVRASLLQNVLRAVLGWSLRQKAQLRRHADWLRFTECKLHVAAVGHNVRINVTDGRQATLLKARLRSKSRGRQCREQLQGRRWQFFTDDKVLVGMLQCRASCLRIIGINLETVLSHRGDVDAEDGQFADNTE